MSAALRIRASFARSFAHRGRLGTLAFLAYYPILKLKQQLVRFTPGFRQWHASHHAQDVAFDNEHGFDTSGKLYPVLDEALGDNRFYGNFYAAVPAAEFRDVMTRLPITHRDYAFIDYGSGKGRALLLAAEWSFHSVIGVEYAPELHEVAQDNIARYLKLGTSTSQFELHCMDAAAYALPKLPTIVFMNNPFGQPVIEQVLAAIRRSLRDTPRDLWIVYHYPLIPKPFREADFLEHIYSCDAYQIYQAHTPQAG